MPLRSLCWSGRLNASNQVSGRSTSRAMVHSAVPARDAGAFVAFARTNPGRLSYATLGPGTITRLATEAM
jgi:hypothetical protein